MSNATYTGPSGQGGALAEGEERSALGVRKVLEAYAEREVQEIRWGAVCAGLALAVGAQILLGLLGNALGLTAEGVRVAHPLVGVTAAATVWSTVTCMATLFVGGYAASKLGGAIRRSDGIIAGLLTWASSLIIALTMVSQSPILMSIAAQRTETISGAWLAFAGAILSLLTAMLGGALGSASGQIKLDEQRREAQRRAREMKEAARQD